MKNNPAQSAEKTYGCETCPMRKKAEENPKSILARLWRWHTSWCPGWREYQAHLTEQANT